jgi:hypothetical protein
VYKFPTIAENISIKENNDIIEKYNDWQKTSINQSYRSLLKFSVNPAIFFMLYKFECLLNLYIHDRVSLCIKYCDKNELSVFFNLSLKQQYINLISENFKMIYYSFYAGYGMKTGISKSQSEKMYFSNYFQAGCTTLYSLPIAKINNGNIKIILSLDIGFSNSGVFPLDFNIGIHVVTNVKPKLNN